MNLYSLQGDPFLFVLNCPSGYNCNPDPAGGTVSMQCCDEVLTRTFPASVTNAQYNALIAALVTECAARLPFCDKALPPQPPDNPEVLYWNRPQTCKLDCKDGNHFFYTLGAGKLFASTQSEADLAAMAEACRLAKLHIMCLSELPSQWCANVAFTKVITASNANYVQPNFWKISVGTLPTGLTFNGGYAGDKVSITGTPTTAGSYTFTVQITNHFGDTMAKVYTICIVEITPQIFPAITIGVPMSVQMSAGCAVPDLWSVTSGNLPAGLSLDSITGLISGTPTQAMTKFTIGVRNANGSLFCTKSYPSVLAYWTLDEAAGDKIDKVQSIHLNPMSFNPGLGPISIVDPAGLYGNSWGSLTAGGQNTSIALATTDLNTAIPQLGYPGGGISIWGWFKASNWNAAAIGGGTFKLVFMNNQPTAILQILIQTPLTGVDFGMTAIDSLGATSTLSLATNPTTGSWHFFHIFYDATLQKYGGSLDNAAPVVSPVMADLPISAANNLFAQFIQGGFPSVTIDGEIDEFGIVMGTTLTAAQITYLYNGGLGRTWPIVLP